MIRRPQWHGTPDSQGVRHERQAIFQTLFEPDILLPVQHKTSSGLPPASAVSRALIDSALRDLTLPVTSKPRQEALEWIRDVDGERATYDVTFGTAVQWGYVGLDADILSERIVRLYTQMSMGRDHYRWSRSPQARRATQLSWEGGH